jgi:hypothetical protein
VPQRYFTDPYQFVPPYRGTGWCRLMAPIVKRQLQRAQGVERWHLQGVELLRQSLAEKAGILLAANHCRWADPSVLGMLGRELDCFFYYLVSSHIFKQGRFWGWLYNRIGGFSVLREGADHEAIRAASRILVDAERPIVVFPEGTWFRQNDRLGPLQEGVALMARHAARSAKRAVVIHPIAIKYWALADPRPILEQRVARLEALLTWLPQTQLDVLERILKLSSALLTVKEIECYGQPGEGSLDERIAQLGEAHVGALEKLNLLPSQGHLLERIRRVRQRLVRRLPEATLAERQTIQQELDDLLFCENLRAHSEDYLRGRPGPERLIEALQRIEETITDCSELPVVPLGAAVEVGPALRVQDFPRPKPAERSGGDPLMSSLATAIQGLLDRQLAQGPPGGWRW